MKRRSFFPALQVVCAVAALALSVSAGAADQPEERDGLQPTKVKGIQKAYVRPDANLAQYNKVMLDPISVSFARGSKTP